MSEDLGRDLLEAARKYLTNPPHPDGWRDFYDAIKDINFGTVRLSTPFLVNAATFVETTKKWMAHRNKTLPANNGTRWWESLVYISRHLHSEKA